MAVDPLSLKILLSVSNEMEAAAIVDALADAVEARRALIFINEDDRPIE